MSSTPPHYRHQILNLLSELEAEQASPHTLPDETPSSAEAPTPESAASPSGAPGAPGAESQLQQQSKDCLVAGKHIFFHIMKTAGIAADDFIDCLCDDASLGVLHDEYGPSIGNSSFHGNSECREFPAVLSTHSPPRGLDARLAADGSSWVGARNVTILRNPVDRLWSYYAYGREKGFVPFLDRPLKWFLARPEVNVNLFYNLSSADEYATNFTFHQSELFNRMTGFFGSPGPVAKDDGTLEYPCGGITFGHTGCGSANWTAEYREALEKQWYDEAVKTLEGLAYIGFTEESDGLTGGISEAWPELSARTASDCQLRSENPSSYDDLEREPDDETRELIMKSNKMDMDLYNRAREIMAKARAAKSAVDESNDNTDG